ncbi:MAG: Gldg family protein, partial [Acidimicrobiia bacterium]
MSRPLAGTAAVARRELRAYFATPWPYLVAAAFLFLTGVVFYVVADGAREASLRFWFPNLAFVLTVTTPIVTSRLLAEEWRSRHLDVLLSRAVGPGAVLTGKWLAATTFVVILLVPTLVYVCFLAAWGTPDYPPIIAAYVGAVLLVAMFCAVGTLTSALTPTAVAAGLGSLALLVAAQLASSVDALEGISFQSHLDAFSRGAPALEDLVYFVSATAAALVVATASQITRRQTMSRARSLVIPAVALAAAVALNWVPVPAQARVDVTSTGRFTLSEASQDVLENVDTTVRVTVFEPSGTAEARDAEVLLRQFRRQNRRVEFRVLDFSTAVGEALRLGAADDGDVVVEALDRREVFSPLTEQAVTSAIQRLVRAAPQHVCALGGHGERELDDVSPGGYDLARRTMQANGIEAMRLDLTVAEAVPAECTILVLPGPTANLLEREVDLIGDFLAAQGRMLITTEPGGPDLNAITEPWGLRILPGVVIDPERGAAGDSTTLLVNRFPSTSPVVEEVSGVQMVGAAGLTEIDAGDRGLTVTEVAESSDSSWLETDETEDAYEPDRGDRGGPVL